MEQREEKQQYGTLKRRSNIILERGRIVPQAPELESAVLGAILIDKRALGEVMSIFHADETVFYKPANQEIYKVVVELYELNEPVDILTVANRLKEKNLLDEVGGELYLVELSQTVSSSAHIEHHARLVQERHFKRRLIQGLSSVAEKCYEESEDVFDLMDEAEKNLFDITNSNIRKETESAESLVHQAVSRVQMLYDTPGSMSGLPSGFRDIDEVTSGWQKSDLIIIAARPGMGKTAFVVSMAKNMAIKHNIPIALFSLEMSSVQIILRMISSETGISGKKLREGTLQQYEMQILRESEKIKNLENAPIFIDDTPAISLLEFRSKARKLVSKGVKLIIVDYLQLMTAGKDSRVGNREQEISTISRTLKAIAKELDIPIVAIAQLSRGAEGGAMEGAQTHRRPMLQHLRESGAIEQDADIVSFIYRPEYYKITTWDDGITNCEGQAEFIIAKHRNGEIKNVKLAFIKEITQFTDLELTAMPDTSKSVKRGTFAIEDNYGNELKQSLPSNAFDNDIDDTRPSSINDLPDDTDTSGKDFPF